MRWPRLRRAPSAPPEPPPAPFVIGVGRSGTTLLRLMLDAHPELAIPPETRFVPRLIVAARPPDATAAEVVATLTAERNWADFGLEPDVVLERLRAAPKVTPRAAVRSFFEAYAARFGKERWGDKTPVYGRRMPLIARAVPEARFVHVVRDPRDVAVSWRHFRELRGDDPLTAEHWAQAWAQTIIETRVKASRVAHYLEVRYEDLVSEPEATLRSVCEFIELPFSERMLAYHLSADERLSELESGLPAGGEQPARSAADRIAPHALTKEPPRADRVGTWREALSDEEVATVEAITGDLLP
jgi:hypothetical protein